MRIGNVNIKNGALHGFFIASVICAPSRSEGEVRKRWISLSNLSTLESSSHTQSPP